MLTFMLGITVSAINLSEFKHSINENQWFWKCTANFIDLFLPDYFDGLIHFSVVEHPCLFSSSVILVGVYI